jgi:hypothetical protein
VTERRDLVRALRYGSESGIRKGLGGRA